MRCNNLPVFNYPKCEISNFRSISAFKQNSLKEWRKEAFPEMNARRQKSELKSRKYKSNCHMRQLMDFGKTALWFCDFY